jgi:hypothetical protein
MEIVETNSQARRLAMLCHLLSFAYCILRMGLVLAPALIWMSQRRHYTFVDDQGRESVNFQITVLLAALVALGLANFVPKIGYNLLFVIGLIHLVLTFIAAYQANRGVAYRYPLCWRLIK